MGVEERQLWLEERTEAQRQGFAGVISTINGLSTAIHALVTGDSSHSHGSARPRPFQLHPCLHHPRLRRRQLRVRDHRPPPQLQLGLFRSPPPAMFAAARPTSEAPCNRGLGANFRGHSIPGFDRSSAGEEKSHVQHGSELPLEML
jgi:hypothetical protein